MDRPSDIQELLSSETIKSKCAYQTKRPIKTVGDRHTRHVSFGCKSISILEDSHVRGLATRLLTYLSDKTVVSSMVKPGATYEQVVIGCQDPITECVILVAGANNVYRGEAVYINKLELTVSMPTKLLIIGNIPYRYDLPQHHHFKCK